MRVWCVMPWAARVFRAASNASSLVRPILPVQSLGAPASLPTRDSASTGSGRRAVRLGELGIGCGRQGGGGVAFPAGDRAGLAEDVEGLVEGDGCGMGLAADDVDQACSGVARALSRVDFSAGGDSGALYLESHGDAAGRRRVLGLHWAGSGNDGVGHRIQDVFADLGLTVLPTDDE